MSLWRDYNLPLNDDSIKKMSVSHWKYFVKSAIFNEALFQLQVELSSNRKTNYITYQHSSLKPNDYLLQLASHLARLVLKPKPGCWISRLIIKENIKMVYIVIMERLCCHHSREDYKENVCQSLEVLCKKCNF